MGYHTVKIVFGVPADDLHDHVRRHIALYRPRSANTAHFEISILSGVHCSAVWSGNANCPAELLDPIGHQLARLWMDVRYQDGDSWDLSCYTGFEHELTHTVNPWPYDSEFTYDAAAQRAIDFRTDKLCRLLPEFAETIRPYLLLWRYPKDLTNPKSLVDRKGKAQETDEFCYGDADQFYDFLRCFAIDTAAPMHEIDVCL